MRMTTFLATGALTATALAATSVTAQAGGFAVREQSIYGLGSAFAGIAAPGGTSPSSMFWNPAAITSTGKGITAESNFSFIVPRSEIDVLSATSPAFVGNPRTGGAVPLVRSNPVIDATAAILSGVTGQNVIAGNQDLGTSGTGDIAQDAAVPSSYSAINLGVLGLDDRISVGMSITAPFGLVTKNDYDSAARFHGRTSELRVINATPTVGFEVNEMLSLGVGLQISYADVRLTQASAVLATDPRGNPIAGPAGPFFGYEADSEFAGDDIAFGVSAGLTYTPNETTTIGLGFRSTVDHELDGDAKLTGPTPALTRDLGGIKADLQLPETVTFGYRQDMTERFTLLAGVEWTNWSRFGELRVRFDEPGLADNATAQNYEDGWFFSLGGEFKATDALTVRAGAAYEISPVRDEFRTPRLPDSDRIWTSLGATYEIDDRFSFDVSYAHVFAEEASIDLPAGKEPTRGAFSATADSSVDIFGFSFRTKLGHHDAPVEDVYYKP